MRVIGLISGGKDSLLSCTLCSVDHELVGFVHMEPKEGQKDNSFTNDSPHGTTDGPKGEGIHVVGADCEVDSVTFQSVGSSLLQQALPHLSSLPLIVAAMDDQAGELGALATLLGRARQAWQADAVVSGAVDSNHQRDAFEAAAASAGLLSLAPMWRWPPARVLWSCQLLGLRPIFVKVAGAGLPVHLLGRSIDYLGEPDQAMRDGWDCDADEQLAAAVRELPRDDEAAANAAVVTRTLDRAAARFGVHQAGEGGEFESFALSGPLYDRASLVVGTTHTVLVTDDDVAPVAALSVDSFSLGPPAASSAADILGKPKRNLSIPARPFYLGQPSHTATSAAAADAGTTPSAVLVDPSVIVTTLPGDVRVVTHIPVGDSKDLKAALAMGLEAAGAGADAAEVAFVSLWLPNMSAYGEVNQAYAPLFVESQARGAPWPARAAVQGVDGAGRLDLVLVPGARRNIHVQSVSNWAPASIGPYSQASLTDAADLVAGQIGLVPWTMALAGPTVDDEAVQAARNVARVLADGRQRGAPVGIVVCRTSEQALPHPLLQRIVSTIPGADMARVVQRHVARLPKGAAVELVAVASSTLNPLEVLTTLY
uniref:Diphthine--ammonia ligase n=1 Tax=Sexangularia sp. CB-2014 TaxID=1486929 RepID=A0A7S1VID0_9EUKA|mmetsp:Transcript_3135/g.10269  ORF Transcript_3135/g.10269 Transcript_3135/m.10269 type:complete len:597 (+) Transcript_3135:214-2004(+)